MPIWDLHCHLSGVDGDTPDQRMARLIEIADRVGVERFVFFMGYPWSQDPTPDEFRRQNYVFESSKLKLQESAIGRAHVEAIGGTNAKELAPQ